jgi:uncharacterized tellurite resistance protein B-like protein
MWGPVNVEAARAELEQKFDAALQLPLYHRAQLVQHLTIVAAADGNVDQFELGEMGRIAWRLQVDPQVIEQTLAGAAHPMD